MMDRDFPPTRRQLQATVLALAIGGVIGLLLFGGAIPGLHPNYASSPYTTLDGRTYYWTSVPVPTPLPGSPRTSPSTVLFHNVTFRTWVTNWSIFGGAYFRGNATETNGTVYSFVLGGPPFAPGRTEEYVAPGGAVAAEWTGSFDAYLLVLA